MIVLVLIAINTWKSAFTDRNIVISLVLCIWRRIFDIDCMILIRFVLVVASSYYLCVCMVWVDWKSFLNIENSIFMLFASRMFSRWLNDWMTSQIAIILELSRIQSINMNNYRPGHLLLEKSLVICWYFQRII